MLEGLEKKINSIMHIIHENFCHTISQDLLINRLLFVLKRGFQEFYRFSEI